LLLPTVLAVKLKDEYQWFLTQEFRNYWNEFKYSLNPRNSKLSQNKKENLDKKGLRNTLDWYRETNSDES